MRSAAKDSPVTMPCPANDHTRVADALRRANQAELQYAINCMESAASPEMRRAAKCRMYQAERDLICAIGGEPDVVMKGRNAS
jgi:hypothetical protein